MTWKVLPCINQGATKKTWCPIWWPNPKIQKSQHCMAILWLVTNANSFQRQLRKRSGKCPREIHCAVARGLPQVLQDVYTLGLKSEVMCISKYIYICDIYDCIIILTLNDWNKSILMLLKLWVCKPSVSHLYYEAHTKNTNKTGRLIISALHTTWMVHSIVEIGAPTK